MRLFALLALLAACSDGTDDTPVDLGCSACEDGEYCLVYFEAEDTREECVPLPAACSGDDSCECRGEMYDGCEDPFIGVGCSDTLAPTQISCNQ